MGLNIETTFKKIQKRIINIHLDFSANVIYYAITLAIGIGIGYYVCLNGLI